MSRSTLLLLVLAVAGCSDAADQSSAQTSSASAPSSASAQAPSGAMAVEPTLLDAGAPAAGTRQGAVAKASDLHFDDYGGEAGLRRRPAASGREGEIELLLRSTPPGAVAAIDGRRIGVTPVLWRTARSGQANEFTFVLPGYAMARYRFVPTRSGIVHGTLKKLAEPAPDGGPAPSRGPQRKP